MILINCTNCAFTVRIFGSDESEMQGLVGPGSDWWPDKYPCTKCGGKMKVTTIDAKMLANLRVVDLNPQEAFVAFSGGGIPSDLNCTVESVKALLEGAVIEKVEAHTVSGTRRSLLNSITLKSGERIYLASSVHGAVVYRIASPHNYTKEALHE